MEWRRKLLRMLAYPIAWPVIGMPGRSYEGPLTALSAYEQSVRADVECTLRKLAVDIGERTERNYSGLLAAEDFIAAQFRSMSSYEVTKQTFFCDGVDMSNVIAEKRGGRYPLRIIVVGAHYDTVYGTGGADDNSSGVAALLAIARLLKDRELPYTVRFVAFANEENQNTGPQEMGSYHYAKLCHDRGESIEGMISLEMLGYYSDQPGSQKYPSPFNLFFPDVGNFVGFVGNLKSRAWVRKCIGAFRKQCRFPSEGAAVPERFRDIARSDHWSFWQFNVPALMITDTSNFRNKLYHTSKDEPSIIDFDRLARLTVGLAEMVAKICS